MHLILSKCDNQIPSTLHSSVQLILSIHRIKSTCNQSTFVREQLYTVKYMYRLDVFVKTMATYIAELNAICLYEFAQINTQIASVKHQLGKNGKLAKLDFFPKFLQSNKISSPNFRYVKACNIFTHSVLHYKVIQKNIFQNVRVNANTIF